MEQDKGILVNFGTDETGIGLVEPSPPPSRTEAAAAKVAIPADNTAKEEQLLAQNFDKEAPVIKKVDPEADKRKREKIEADRIRQAEITAEKEKKAAEDAEKKRIEAEQKRTSDIMNRTKNALAGSKNTGTSSTGEGITGGPGNQGDPNGDINSKVRGKGSGSGDSGNGVSYKLEGRGFQDLPYPRYDYQGEGIVIVEVSVDQTGKVIQADPGKRGSTTVDDYLLSVAKEAALKAKFDRKADAPRIQKGTITYNFKLK